MGNPDFAIPSLRILLDSVFSIKGVVTATDKKGDRGRKKLIQSEIKKFAIAHHLQVLQPKNLKTPAFHEELKKLRPDLFVVVAFRVLPIQVLDIPPLGTINLHASLLPKYRGAAPINWAIINGESETGLTTFLIRKEIDTGSILFQEKIHIGPEETAGELHDRMMAQGAELVLKTVKVLASGDYPLKEQDHTKATMAPKIFHHMCEIDFNRPGQDIVNFVRGLSPHPGAWMKINGTITKVYSVRKTERVERSVNPGNWKTDNQTYLRISSTDTWIEVYELKLAGSRRMDIRSFLNGHKIREVGQ